MAGGQPEPGRLREKGQEWQCAADSRPALLRRPKSLLDRPCSYEAYKLYAKIISLGATRAPHTLSKDFVCVLSAAPPSSPWPSPRQAFWLRPAPKTAQAAVCTPKLKASANTACPTDCGYCWPQTPPSPRPRSISLTLWAAGMRTTAKPAWRICWSTWSLRERLRAATSCRNWASAACALTAPLFMTAPTILRPSQPAKRT